MRLFGIAFLLILFVGFIFAFIENKVFLNKRGSLPKLGKGIYWSVGVFTGVGSDITPTSIYGRILMSMYTIICVLLITLLTGNFSSFTTMSTISVSQTQDINSIQNKVLGVKKDTIGHVIAVKKGLPYRLYNSYPDIVKSMQNGQINGLLVPSILAHRIKHQYSGIINLDIYDLLPTVMYYAYIVKKDSKFLDVLNDAILSTSYEGGYTSIINNNVNHLLDS